VEFTVYNVNGIVKRGKRSKRDFSTEWISSCLDFRQTDLNQCSALTYKSLSGCRQLKDVWQVKLKCVSLLEFKPHLAMQLCHSNWRCFQNHASRG